MCSLNCSLDRSFVSARGQVSDSEGSFQRRSAATFCLDFIWHDHCVLVRHRVYVSVKHLSVYFSSEYNHRLPNGIRKASFSASPAYLLELLLLFGGVGVGRIYRISSDSVRFHFIGYNLRVSRHRHVCICSLTNCMSHVAWCRYDWHLSASKIPHVCLYCCVIHWNQTER